MPNWGWIVVVAAILVIAIGLVAVTAGGRHRRTRRLKERFGPEYDRAVAQSGGQGTAEKELAARERQREKLDIRPLSNTALAAFSDRWRTVQTVFVDSPSAALDEADRLVTEVMRERGYPVDTFDRRAADISVDHPSIVDNYRGAHDIVVLQHHGSIGTEEQRQAFVHYRALFDTLLNSGDSTTPTQDNDTTQETRG